MRIEKVIDKNGSNEMNEMMIGILRMPDEMFWDDDPITREEHNRIRIEAADELVRQAKVISQLASLLTEANIFIDV